MSKPVSALTTTTTVSVPRILSPTQVEAEYGFPVNTLKYWRYQGIGPDYIKTGDGPGGVVRYRRSAIETWLDDHTVQTDTAAHAA